MLCTHRRILHVVCYAACQDNDEIGVGIYLESSKGQLSELVVQVFVQSEGSYINRVNEQVVVKENGVSGWQFGC